MVSRRIVLMSAVAIVVLVAGGGLLSAAVHDVTPLFVALVASLAVLVLMLSRSSHNQLRALEQLVVSTSDRPAPVVEGPRYVPGSDLDMLRRDLQRDVSAMLLLHKTVDARGRIPSPGGWAATPDTILTLVTLIMDAPSIETVVECGSGTSTAWMGLALKMRGSGRLISLEHDLEYVESSRRLIRDAGLDGIVEVRHAPLAQIDIDGRPVTWYSVESPDDIGSISLLFVDGPPGHIGAGARFPALPFFEEHLDSDAVVVLDDIDRDDEIDTLARWTEATPGKPVWHPILHTDRAVVLQRVPGEA